MVKKSGLHEDIETSGNAIYDPLPWDTISPIVKDWFSDHSSFGDRTDVLQEYLLEYPKYLAKSNLNKITGLETLKYRYASIGVTQSLDEFHWQCLKQGRTLKMLRGEYPYNRDMYPHWEYIDDKGLHENDCVILSCPFSGSGNKHKETENILIECDKLNIPVLIDMAWFGTCGNISIDLSHDCIKHVSFSTTKGLSCGQYRNGIRFSREQGLIHQPGNSDRLATHTEWNHSVHLNFAIGLTLIKTFDPDYIYNKYRASQLEVCSILGLEASNCIHIATKEGFYSSPICRDKKFNRFNIRKLVKRFYRENKI